MLMQLGIGERGRDNNPFDAPSSNLLRVQRKSSRKPSPAAQECTRGPIRLPQQNELHVQMPVGNDDEAVRRPKRAPPRRQPTPDWQEFPCSERASPSSRIPGGCTDSETCPSKTSMDVVAVGPTSISETSGKRLSDAVMDQGSGIEKRADTSGSSSTPSVEAFTFAGRGFTGDQTSQQFGHMGPLQETADVDGEEGMEWGRPMPSRTAREDPAVLSTCHRGRRSHPAQSTPPSRVEAWCWTEPRLGASAAPGIGNSHRHTIEEHLQGRESYAHGAGSRETYRHLRVAGL